MSGFDPDGLRNWATDNQANGLPQLILPSGSVSISECAEELFKLIAPTKRLFVRGGAVVNLSTRDDGLLALEILRPSAARSLFEKFARLCAWRTGANNEPVLKHVTCAQEMADALLHTEEAMLGLPRVQGLINCPILREVDGKVLVAGKATMRLPDCW